MHDRGDEQNNVRSSTASSSSPSSLEQGFTLHQWTIEPLKGLFVTQGHRLHVEPKLIDVLLCLARHYPQVVSRQQLLDEVWQQQIVTDEVLTRCISELRTALNDTSRQRIFIRTVPKRGYTLLVKPEAISPQEAPTRLDRGNELESIGDTTTATADVLASTTQHDLETPKVLPDSTVLQPPRTTRFVKRVNKYGERILGIKPSFIMLFLLFYGAVWLGKITFERLSDGTSVVSVAKNMLLSNAGDNAALKLNDSPGVPTALIPALDIAVLPFVNLNEQKNDYFSEGLAEDIRNQLISTKSIRVAARRSSEAFRGQAMDIREVGQRLNATYLLEGTVRRYQERIRITVQLTESKMGVPLWADSYEKEMNDLFELQAQIANAIVEQIAPALGAQAALPLQNERTANNIEAYDSYLLGRYHWNQRTKESVEVSVEHFRRAIQLDPEFALAYSGLADSIMILYNYAPTHPDAKLDEAEALIDKALSLDSSCAEAYASRGLFAFNKGNIESSLIDYQKALDINPNYSMARVWLGLAWMRLGFVNQAFPHLQVALSLDPLHPVVQHNYANALSASGRYQDMLALRYLDPTLKTMTMLEIMADAYEETRELDTLLTFMSSQYFPRLNGKMLVLGQLDALEAFYYLQMYDEAEALRSYVLAKSPTLSFSPDFFVKLTVKSIMLAIGQRDVTVLNTLAQELTLWLAQNSQLDLEWRQCYESYIHYTHGVSALFQKQYEQAQSHIQSTLQTLQTSCNMNDIQSLTNWIHVVADNIYVQKQRSPSADVSNDLQRGLNALQRLAGQGFDNIDTDILLLRLYVAAQYYDRAEQAVAQMREKGRYFYADVLHDPILESVKQEFLSEVELKDVQQHFSMMKASVSKLDLSSLLR